MNFSVSFLSISSISRSPFLMKTASYTNSKLLFDKVKANSFFSSFLKTHSPKFNISFHKSSFRRFLDTPIKASSMTIDGETITNRKIVECDSSINIENCQFQDCRTSETGGAIFINCSSAIAVIKNSDFEACCSTNGNCGAIYSSVLKSTAIVASCFLNCSALYSYQAFLVNVTSKAALNQSGFHYCGIDAYQNAPKFLRYFHDLMSIARGTQRVSFCNFSRNKVNGGIAGFSSTFPKKGRFMYFNIDKNRGGYAFERFGMAEYDENISYANILNHNAENIGSMHLQIFAKVTNFVFKNITIDPFVYGESGALVALEDSIFDAAEIDLRVISPIGDNSNILQMKNCHFMVKHIVPLKYDQPTQLQCARNDVEDKIPLFDRFAQFFESNPHVCGLLMCGILALLAVLAYLHSKENIEVRIPLVFQRNPKDV